MYTAHNNNYHLHYNLHNYNEHSFLHKCYASFGVEEVKKLHALSLKFYLFNLITDPSVHYVKQHE